VGIDVLQMTDPVGVFAGFSDVRGMRRLLAVAGQSATGLEEYGGEETGEGLEDEAEESGVSLGDCSEESPGRELIDSGGNILLQCRRRPAQVSGRLVANEDRRFQKDQQE
jgi:hypothetical protein